MGPSPLYEPGAAPCYVLYFGWTGWPTVGTLFPTAVENLLTAPCSDWEKDGLRLLEKSFSPKRILMTFSVTPLVSPVFFTGRVKGRLHHVLRNDGLHVRFSRKVAMVSIGENHRTDVENYIEKQTEKEKWCDPRMKEQLRPFSISDSAIDLSKPSESISGRYWYNLHLVLTAAERWRNSDPRWLEKIRDQSIRIALKKGYAISRLAVMPDHIHMSLRGNIDHAPEEIALAFQNNLAYVLGQVRVWQSTYYVGTFGEYDMNAVRSWEE
jgi:REP element-mobilizing transposase RayT